jgi:hypothetical protein
VWCWENKVCWSPWSRICTLMGDHLIFRSSAQYTRHLISAPKVNYTCHNLKYLALFTNFLHLVVHLLLHKILDHYTIWDWIHKEVDNLHFPWNKCSAKTMLRIDITTAICCYSRNKGINAEL